MNKTYLLVQDGMIVNTVICTDDESAAQFGALPYYEGAAIGDAYAPPIVYTELELVQQDITDLQLSDIEQGQAITEVELMILEGQT